MSSFIKWLLQWPLPIVKPHQVKNVLSHYYVGDNKSILYRTLISPACDAAVNRFPKWLAPNTVTAIGMFVNIIPSILLPLWYGWDLDGYISPAFCLLIGVCYVFYMFMDNCDGK